MDFYDKMKPVVVLVELYYEDDKIDWDCEGTGVFVSPQGHVLTLSHLFNDDPNAILRVVTKDDDKYDCNILDVDPASGFALLQVKNLDEKMKFSFSYAEIHKGELDIGEEIYFIGHSHFLDYSYPIGEISFPLRRYGGVLEYIEEAKNYKSNEMTKYDPSEEYLCFVDDLEKLKLKHSVSLVQVNNIHGDGLGGSSEMPFFDSLGHIIGIYSFTAHDQCYGNNARSIRAYLKKKLKKKELSDVSGHGQASSSVI